MVSRRDWSEADRIYWIYTRDLGLIQALAKGVRKLLARMGGHLQLGNRLDLRLYKGKTFYTITEVTIKESFAWLRRDLIATSQLYHYLELIKVLVPLEQKGEKFYGLLLESIRGLNLPYKRRLKIFFELNLIGRLGFGPEFFHCASCASQLQPGRNFFSIDQGGVLCENCGGLDKKARQISDMAIKLARWLAVEEIANLAKLKLIEPKEKELERTLSDYLEYLAERRLASDSFIKQVKGL